MNRKLKHRVGTRCLLSGLARFMGMSFSSFARKQGHTLNISGLEDLREYFRYTADRIPHAASHRGGASKGTERLKSRERRMTTYREIIRNGVDIILAHNLFEVSEAIGPLRPQKSRKDKFFRRKNSVKK